MNEEKLKPIEDLKVKEQTLSGFIEKVSPRYFRGETAVSAEDMQRIADDLAAAGRKEFANYGLLSSMRKERKGVGVITIDCSKVVPQENFQKLADEDKQKDPKSINFYDIHVGQAYALGLAREVALQMLDLIKNKPRFRPEDKHFSVYLEKLPAVISGLLQQDGGSVAKGYYSSIPINLERLAQSLGLEKFTIVLTHTEKIPEHVKKDFRYMQNRPQGENNTRVMMFSKEKSPEDVMEKIHEVRERLSEKGNYNDESKKLLRALDWYSGARTSLAQLEQDIKRKEKDRLRETVIPNQMDAIKSHGYNFYDLDEEFRFFDDDEIRQIKEGIVVL